MPSPATGMVLPAIPTAPYPPSPVESKYYYYGIPSRPFLVARSSFNVWVQPAGPGAFPIPKELSPAGLISLCNVWETIAGPDIVKYLDLGDINWTSLDPVCVGYAGESSPPVIIWIGVVPGSLSAEAGIEVATTCKYILSTYGITDIEVEIRESTVTSSVFAGPKMYKPAPTSDPTAAAQEPFSTALGFPICAEATPFAQGTSGFYFSDSFDPGNIYLVTARHVVFHPDKGPNDLYLHCNPSQPTKNVLILSDTGVNNHVATIKSEIKAQGYAIQQLERRLEISVQMNKEDAEAEEHQTRLQLAETERTITNLNKFCGEISRDWGKQENRIFGYVTLSPPIGFGVGEEGFTEDWAVIRVSSSKVDSTNFVGNAIDLGTTIPVSTFADWMHPHFANPSSFVYPGDRLLRLSGIIPDTELRMPSERTLDHDGFPCIMVIKQGSTSGLTIGRLNHIRSFTRTQCKGVSGAISKEIAVLPRTSKSGAFSAPGDSGSVVFDGKGRLAGLITGGSSGDTEVSDCTYLTSIEFILKRLQGHGIKPNLYPSLA